ncbi:MAG TPA: diadenylate cyclase [Deltaproteobacteria bacterium]|nr:diadenylate cyclase [Deltaproteobacteria bacterium]
MSDTFFTFLAGFRIQDFFDIAIISFLLYLAIVWFKHATSKLVLVGMILLGVVYIGARLFHLYLTTIVLQSFFTVIIIALVVIFQEDIRRFFERLATLRNLARHRRKSAEGVDGAVSAIVESSAELASRRIGALIVIEGEDPIDRQITGGYTLNGVLTSPLVMSIFDPHSQGHDGALVVRNGRAFKFGCHLPLSTNTEKLANFGLRHTAALGLSERCDALAIVISEEKGTISVVRNAEIVTLKNAIELNSVLEQFFEKTFTDGGKHAKGGLGKNALEKGLALVLAVGLWFVFGYQRESIQRDYIVPIEYRKISPEWEIEESRVTDATVTLMGSTQAFRLFDPSSLKISIDLSSLEEGRQVVVITSDMVNVPSNLTLLKVRPDRIIITAHRLFPRDVKVTPDMVGRPEEGYEIRQVTVEPEFVSVLAPFAITASRISVITEPIDVSGITSSHTYTVKVIPSTSRVRFKAQQQPTVRVTVEVERTSRRDAPKKGT